MSEELGLDGGLTLVKKYLMPPFSERGLTELEWVALFACRTDSPCTVDRVELEGVQEVTEEELLGMLEGGLLTPGAKSILADYLKPRAH